MNTLLVHQFHDLLPGTCIHSAHEESLRSMGEAIQAAEGLIRGGLRGEEAGLTLYNPLSFERRDTLHLEGEWPGLGGALTQTYTDIEGRTRTAVGGLTLPAFGSLRLDCAGEQAAPSPFTLTADGVETPFASLRFDENGAIASLVDRRTGRELVSGLPFNTFLMAEDMPALWDNWDVDADLMEKFAPCAALERREVVSDGPVEMRIRSVWRMGEKSRLTQDMVLDAASPLITFDTLMDWQEDHRFLKAAFDTALVADSARCEIQFGHIRRSTHRSTSAEKARFEVSQHKYTDLSEQNFGIALLNDCKYGLSIDEGRLWLSLHKGGLRLDRAGDKGLHRCSYALLPHPGGFDVPSVVRPAYCFNLAPAATPGGKVLPSLCAVDAENVIIETVNPARTRRTPSSSASTRPPAAMRRPICASACPCAKCTAATCWKPRSKSWSRMRGLRLRPSGL